MSTVVTQSEPCTEAPAERGARLHFPEALPGLVGAHAWEMVEHDEARPFLWMRSLDRAGLTLLVLDPRLVAPEYQPRVGAIDLARIELDGLDGAVLLSIVTRDEDGAAYINLRAPVLLNPNKLLGAQIILDDPDWPLRHPLDSGREEAAEGTGRSPVCSSSAASQDSRSSSAKRSE